MTDIPAQGAPASWPEHGPDPAAVRAWIAAALPDAGVVSGPTVVHRAHAWGLTARFAVAGAGERDATDTTDVTEVVFKASFLPASFGVAGPYRLLRAVDAPGTPTLLAWREEPGVRWLLFRPFAGDAVADLPGLAPLVAMAEAMAAIQVRVAERTETHHLLPTGAVPVGDVPAMLDDLVPLAESGSARPDWTAPRDAAARLAASRADVGRWVRDLDTGGWPTTIHHVDLHPHNAVLGSAVGGGALLYDWEEAGLGCPFFSLEKLLQATAERDGAIGAAVVRDAYLDALPWGARADRARAFALAQRLAPICFAHADAAFARALGWSPHEAVAPWITHALDRWDLPER